MVLHYRSDDWRQVAQQFAAACSDNTKVKDGVSGTVMFRSLNSHKALCRFAYLTGSSSAKAWTRSRSSLGSRSRENKIGCSLMSRAGLLSDIVRQLRKVDDADFLADWDAGGLLPVSIRIPYFENLHPGPETGELVGGAVVLQSLGETGVSRA